MGSSDCNRQPPGGLLFRHVLPFVLEDVTITY